MPHRTTRLCVTLLILTLAPLALAEVAPDKIFSSNMVLQREMAVPIWGTAKPGEAISVSFAGQTVKTTADKNGKWRVTLRPLKTSKTAQTMTITGPNTVKLTNILVGEVWLASGQSNMAGRLVAAKKRSLPAEHFKTTDFANFRFIGPNRPWQEFNHRTQNGLSEVAFYFGQKLYTELDIPIGLIVRATSGTPVQSWMSPAVAEAARKKLNIPANWGDPKKPNRVATDYTPQILPIAGVAMRGVIWYQGERNAKTYTGWEYQYLLPIMIDSWRALWAKQAGQTRRDFPFYYVQVPVQTTTVTEEWPEVRDAMRRVLNTCPNTGMAVFYDHGPSLHPHNKKPSGERLALWALAKDYGRKIVYSGPLLKSMVIKDNKAILSFTCIGGGLKNKADKAGLDFFQLAGADGVYHPAFARVVGDTVEVFCTPVPKPVHVRYLYRKRAPNPAVSLINAEGLPASSFITNNTKPKRTPPPAATPRPARKARPASKPAARPAAK